MTALTTDYLPVCLANKLATYQRGPREAPLLRGTNQSKQWCEPASPLQPSSWLAQATQPDTDGEQHLEGTCSHASLHQVTKYIPLYYRHAAGHTMGEEDTVLEDKLQALQQQTLAMHTNWQQEQAAVHAYAHRKVKAGTPFARPNLTHPKLVGAAGMVPNNMLKHKRKPVKEPDLSKNPSEPQVLHVPSHTSNALLEREGVRRRPPIAKLHCKAFQFPVLMAEQDGKVDRKMGSTAVRCHRGYQMLGSGFKITAGRDTQLDQTF